MNVPDTLSRAFLETPKDKPKMSSKETDVFMTALCDDLRTEIMLNYSTTRSRSYKS